ncbi:hypothetical protein [Streptomyces sp. NPDC056670]|uniref:hypothetical protein n=1 Tax=Streptomyces sp. NPDC056670 TaxID=3345904 RepID=UPI00369F0E56
MDLAATSTEYVKVGVVATAGGSTVDLGTPPKMAFLAGNADPVNGNWHAAEWHSGSARILVGPDGGALTLTPGTYWVWTTWEAGAESPVYRSGRIRVI